MKRKEFIIVSIVMLVLGTSMHFAHHLPFFNHFLGYIFPVNESVWEHMKMIFYPALLTALYLLITRKDAGQISGPIAAGMAGLPFAQALFYGYWIFTGHSLLWLDIVCYVIEIIFVMWLGKKLNECGCVKKLWPLFAVLAVEMIIMLGYLTYHAPDMILFEVEE